MTRVIESNKMYIDDTNDFVSSVRSVHFNARNIIQIHSTKYYSRFNSLILYSSLKLHQFSSYQLLLKNFPNDEYFQSFGAI